MDTKQAEYVVFDVETTGLFPQRGDRIVEIAAVRVKNWQIVDTFESLVNPEREIPIEAQNINHITGEMVAGAQTADLVLPKIIASMLMYPLLVILAGFCSLIGGYIVGTLGKYITPNDYVYGLRFVFLEFSVFFALIKSVVFAFLVSSISSYKGYYTRGGALEVGVASTEAVTSSVIAILIADYLLAQLLVGG